MDKIDHKGPRASQAHVMSAAMARWSAWAGLGLIGALAVLALAVAATAAAVLAMIGMVAFTALRVVGGGTKKRDPQLLEARRTAEGWIVEASLRPH